MYVCLVTGVSIYFCLSTCAYMLEKCITLTFLHGSIAGVLYDNSVVALATLFGTSAPPNTITI